MQEHKDGSKQGLSHEHSITERREKRTSAWWKRYLPTDTKSALTVLVVLTCLIVGVIIALTTGNMSLLLAVLKAIFSLP